MEADPIVPDPLDEMPIAQKDDGPWDGLIPEHFA